MSAENINFQQAAREAMCVDCPVVQMIPEEYWQENIHEGIVFGEENLKEILEMLRTEVRSMKPADLADELNIIHSNFLALFSADDELLQPSFRGRRSGEVRFRYLRPDSEWEYVPEEEIPGTAAPAFLRCMRRILDNRCTTASEELALPQELYEEGMAATALENLARFGKSDEVALMAERVLEALVRRNSPVLRRLYDEKPHLTSSTAARLMLLQAAQLLRGLAAETETDDAAEE